MTAEYIRADRPYNVLATCPACGEHEVILVGLASRLERTRAGSEVGLKVKAGKVEHECDQTRIEVAPVDVVAEAADDRLPFDEEPGGPRMTGLGFVCACGDPGAFGMHSRRLCDLDQRSRVAAAEAQRLAEFRARLEHVASGLESALRDLDRSNDALLAMLRDVKAWSDSIGGGA